MSSPLGFFHSGSVQHWKAITPRHQHSQQHGLWDCHFPFWARDSCALPSSARTIPGREEGEGGGEKGSEERCVSRGEEEGEEEGGGGGEEGGGEPHRDHEWERGLSLQPRALGPAGKTHAVGARERKVLRLPRTQTVSLEETTHRYDTHPHTSR